MTSSNPLKEYSDPVEQNKILQKHLYEWLLPENRQNLTRYLIHLKQSRKQFEREVDQLLYHIMPRSNSNSTTSYQLGKASKNKTL